MYENFRQKLTVVTNFLVSVDWKSQFLTRRLVCHCQKKRQTVDNINISFKKLYQKTTVSNNNSIATPNINVCHYAVRIGEQRSHNVKCTAQNRSVTLTDYRLSSIHSQRSVCSPTRFRSLLISLLQQRIWSYCQRNVVRTEGFRNQ